MVVGRTSTKKMERKAVAARDARIPRLSLDLPRSSNPTKPASYVVAVRPGYQWESDQEEEEESKKENDEEQEGWEFEEEEEFNPYDKNLDIEVGAHVSHEDIKLSFAHLPLIMEKPKPSMRVEMLVVDKDIIARSLVHL